MAVHGASFGEPTVERRIPVQVNLQVRNDFEIPCMLLATDGGNASAPELSQLHMIPTLGHNPL